LACTDPWQQPNRSGFLEPCSAIWLSKSEVALFVSPKAPTEIHTTCFIEATRASTGPGRVVPVVPLKIESVLCFYRGIINERKQDNRIPLYKPKDPTNSQRKQQRRREFWQMGVSRSQRRCRRKAQVKKSADFQLITRPLIR
jgi:hypothetical protein